MCSFLKWQMCDIWYTGNWYHAYGQAINCKETCSCCCLNPQNKMGKKSPFSPELHCPDNNHQNWWFLPCFSTKHFAFGHNNFFIPVEARPPFENKEMAKSKFINWSSNTCLVYLGRWGTTDIFTANITIFLRSFSTQYFSSQ